MPKLFVLLISAMLALSSMAFVHVHHIPHHVHRTAAPIRHARTVVHPRPVHVYHHPRPVYGPVVHDHVYFHVNPLWFPILLSPHMTRIAVETVPVVETKVVETQPIVVQQIVQQQVPEYNPYGLLLIQTNSVSGASN